MIDFGVHTLDSALYLLGNPKPIEVSATLSQHLGTKPNVNPWGQWNYKEFTVEDQVAAFVRFENGASMLLECSWALNVPESKETISLSGTEAGLDVFPLKVNKAQHGMLTHWVPDWMEKENEEPGIGQAADFVNAIKNGGIQLVFNTTEGKQALSDSRSLRRAALLHKVPYYTTLAGSVAATQGIKAYLAGDLEVCALQDYFH